MKKYKYIFSLVFVSLNLFTSELVFAAGSASLKNTNLSGNNINIQPIYIPLFNNFFKFNTDNSNIWVWLSFIGSILTIALVIYWIYRIIRAGVEAMQSQSNPEKLQESFGKVKSVLIAAALSMFFPVILSLIGIFLGIGSIFKWPQMFQSCNGNDPAYQFYFQAYLASKSTDPAGKEADAQAKCP